MDPQGLTAPPPGDDAPVARWTAVAVHHKPLLIFLWASASALAARQGSISPVTGK
jgi:hypothetical protein